MTNDTEIGEEEFREQMLKLQEEQMELLGEVADLIDDLEVDDDGDADRSPDDWLRE